MRYVMCASPAQIRCYCLASGYWYVLRSYNSAWNMSGLRCAGAHLVAHALAMQADRFSPTSLVHTCCCWVCSKNPITPPSQLAPCVVCGNLAQITKFACNAGQQLQAAGPWLLTLEQPWLLWLMVCIQVWDDRQHRTMLCSSACRFIPFHLDIPAFSMMTWDADWEPQH